MLIYCNFITHNVNILNIELFQSLLILQDILFLVFLTLTIYK